jgi:predicted sugar kinase
VGDAPATDTLSDLRGEIRRRLGSQAAGLAEACDELVDATCVWWPSGHMANLARRSGSVMEPALEALDVIEAKVREDIEARFGVSSNTLRALDLLLSSIVLEMAGLWFQDAEARMAMRRAIFAARQRR